MKPFKEIIKVPTEASETVAADFPPKIRPFMRIIIYFGTWVFLLFAIPIMSIGRMFTKNRPSAIKNLQVELETIWHSQSSTKALYELRKVYSMLKDDVANYHFKGINIEPYGKFKYAEYISVVELLYHYEMRHKNWNKANEICDMFLEPLLERKDKMKGALDKYIVYKAKAIYQISGNTTAQEYLLKYIDQNRKDSLINEYLYELRAELK